MGTEILFYSGSWSCCWSPGQNLGQAATLARIGSIGMLSHPSQIDWSGICVWNEQGLKVEGTRVVYAAAPKSGSVWWPRGQGWWQRGALQH